MQHTAMEFFSISPPPFSPSFLSKKPPKFSLYFSPDSHTPPPNSSKIRRPQTPTLKTNPTTPNPPLNPKIPTNPLKNLINTSKPSTPPNPVTNKLWLSSKLSPPPPPPEEPLSLPEITVLPSPTTEFDAPPPLPAFEFRQEGKLFVGNLPVWIKKNEIAEFFRQFGPVKNVVLIKGHDDMERNVGYCFVIYGGPTAASSAAKAVEFDGVEFRGRVLTVRLDNGRRLKERAEERSKWVAAAAAGLEGEREYRSKWHEEREVSRKEFRKVVEAEPENWQAVVSAFQRVKKVL